VSNFDRPSIINVNLAIAKAARVLNVQTAWRRSRRRASAVTGRRLPLWARAAA